jgi:tripartite-type tricarboxylate transporter receptor subunit TctC
VNAGPSVIVGSNAVPGDLKALTAWMKQPGRRAKVSHAGAGSFGHLCAVLFAQSVGADVDYVPYRGGGPALADTVAGHVDLNCGSLIIAAELIKTGQIKGLGVTSREPADALPGVPSLVKLGFKDLDIPFWHGIFAPAGTPRPVVDRLNAALRQAIADPKVIKTFADYGVYAYPPEEQTPEAANALLRGEIKRWADVIRTNKIEATQ